jgi:hypothetical protein
MGFRPRLTSPLAGAYVYPDIVMLPMALFATRILTIGLDDGQQDLSGLAQETFGPVIDALSNFNRTGASGLDYTYSHDT